MNIHEYQAKQLLAKYGAPVSKGAPALTVEEAEKVAKDLNANLYVVKSQIHAGGRGKGKFKETPDAKGGVRVVKTVAEVKENAKGMLGNTLVTIQTGEEGKQVNRLYIESGSDLKKEYYLSLLVDRDVSRVAFVASTEGGMDIEEVAEHTPHLIFTEEIDPSVGLQGFQARRIAFNLGLSGNAFKEMTKFVASLYNAYIAADASMFEINPVLKTSDNKIMAVDAKVNIDDNALYRQAAIADMRDIREENPIEVEAKEVGLNYVDLDGTVGCMVNGAGLAMATMDLIKYAGFEPANFLDVGGTADAKRVETAFRIILKDPNVKAILINIFGGIVRCDRVAQGVVDAYKNMGDAIKVPIIVRLQGTNAEIAKDLIDNSGMPILSAVQFQEAADQVKAALS